MSTSLLPKPPAATDLTIAWLASDAGKQMLATYMQAVYATYNRQYVLTSAGAKQPPVTAQSVGLSSTVELNAP